MQLERLGRIGVFSLFLLCVTSLAGCGFRALTERDAAGTYEANAQWGKSTLVLRADHSFDQTVVRNDRTQAKTQGTWQFAAYAGKSASYGMVAFKPYLAVTHDQNGVLVGGAAQSISRGFLWGITIAADPDYGVSFQKK